jgi:hypothetical protein
MKNIHSPSVFAGAIAATATIFLGLSFPISIDLLIGYAAVGMLVALCKLEYSSRCRRLQDK